MVWFDHSCYIILMINVIFAGNLLEMFDQDRCDLLVIFSESLV